MIFAISNGNIVGTGSGFVFQDFGTVVTCAHVVRGENIDGIMLKFQDTDPMVPAKIVLLDHEHDIALLAYDDAEQKRKPLSPSKQPDDVLEGMSIFFAGYPLAINTLMTHCGIISSKVNDATGMSRYSLDGTVNPGNSGGPLMNMKGEVIGVINSMRQENSNILQKMRELPTGGLVSVCGLDMIEVSHAIINNLQLGIGYAVPAYYIPERTNKIPNKNNKKKQEDK